MNSHYLFLVRKIGPKLYGYQCYVPYKTFFSPSEAAHKFLPIKEKIDDFFLKEHQNNTKVKFKPQLNLNVVANKRFIYTESLRRWSEEKTGKLFIITVMSAHQYLSQACLIVCFGSIMCMDKESGFRQLMSLMGLRRVSYLSAHFILCEIGVMILAMFGTLIHYAYGEGLTDITLGWHEYIQVYATNVIVSWHQFGLGLILCSLAKSTRTVLFPLLALFACLVLMQLVCINNVLDNVIWHRESKLDSNGYFLFSYSHASIHTQILTNAMISGKKTQIVFYMLMQLVMSLILNLTGIYLDCVLNTGTGHKFEWYFPFAFIAKFMGTRTREREQSVLLMRNKMHPTIHRLVEDGKRELTRVWMKDVTKDFVRWRGFRKTTFRAVSKVDMCLQKGEITAILGHNGAGKTTIFSILAGLLPSSSGYISIFGQNPMDAWDAINLRRITGVCTQFDVLEERMTSYEHMRLLGAIKGLTPAAIATETVRLFEQLELDCYTNTATNLLPGGDKRKLSVAMALIGSPRLIMLDEPTSGVDPFSRRCIWRTLRDYRPNRVIVLITHYMDEADILADRKAIMIGGRLVCYGTSRFLKENYNPGYMLYVTCLHKCNMTMRLKKFLCDQVLGVSLIRSFSDQMTFFVKPDAIEELENLLFSSAGQMELRTCCVTSFGFAVTTLEEIFLKLGAEPLDTDAYDASLLQEQLEAQSKSKLDLLKKIKPVLSIRSGQDKTSVTEDYEGSLVPAVPRSEWQVGLRQFGLLIRVLLGLLMLPTPWYMLLRTFLPVIVIATSAVVYHVETTKMPTDVNRAHPEYISRISLLQARQHISIATPITKDKTGENVVDKELYSTDLNCMRNLLGPREPYVVTLPFYRPTSNTGWSEDAKSSSHNFSRFGSTRMDISRWEKTNISVTLILGQQDHDLTHQIILQDFTLWNCMHIRNLNYTEKLKETENTLPWVGDVASWESMWPESHPQMQLGTAVISMITCSVANCILCPLIAGDMVREKELGVLSQLTLYGMKQWAYWGAHFFTHIFQYLLLASFTTIVMFPFEGHILAHWQAIVLHNWINVLTAVDNIFMIYLCSLFFQKAGGAVVLFGSTIMIVIFVNITLFFIPLSLLETSYAVILSLFPFADPFMSLLLTDFRIRLEKVFFFGKTKAHYSPSLRRLLQYNHVKISQITHGVRIILLTALFMGMYIYIRYVTPRRKEREYYKLMRRLQPLSDLGNRQLPKSVQATMEKVLDFVRIRSSSNEKEHTGAVAFGYHLSKLFFIGSMSMLSRLFVHHQHNDPTDEHTKVALKDFSFLVNRGEIMGVLGPSGSGKSTLMNCLATVTQQTTGQAGVMNNHTQELVPNQKAVEQGVLGFCPQHNPIWPNLTVREHLVIYSVIRDLNQRVINNHVIELMHLVNLEGYKDTYAGSLSGGCKRRLSMAISLVGDPSLVIMDEPSCGVDPRSRRNLWKTLLQCIRGSNRGCVITTHFIDEGESLCDQLAILVNGCTLAIGTPLRLKQSYGGSLMVEIKMSRDYRLMPDEADAEVQSSLRGFLRSLKIRFPEIQVVDQFEDRVSLRLPTNSPEMFKITLDVLLDAHTNGAIEDFTISSPTLEQVYFDLAKSQLQV
ncbi:putative ABCA protein [Fasciola hepatica]|uniref:ABCA protein n=2 Tax=Fasciola hepatica TaxID=6192 RepID=A0A4E0RGZ4_FASHE|nr:putative ABCA protein [Fasciola hepatica]